MAKKKEEVPANSGPPRTGILDTITAPLGFFVLALLIVEAFLANGLIFAQLEPAQRWNAVLLGAGMFVLVVLLVWLLVWFKPEHLTYDKTAHLINRGKLRWGSDQTLAPPGGALPTPEEKEAKP
jgi:heme A synthase